MSTPQGDDGVVRQLPDDADRAITSTRNERVKQLVLLHRSKGRRATGRYLIEGPHAVSEALADGVVEEVLGTSRALVELWPVLEAAAVAITEVSDIVLERLSDATSPQGVIAVGRMAPAVLADVVGSGLLIVGCEVNDPGNAGTIIRTADAAGATGVVLTSGSVDPYNPKSVRATTGSLTHLPVVTDVTASEVAIACRAAGQLTLGFDAAADDDVQAAVVGQRNIALFFGSETHGLPSDLLPHLDRVVSIPRYGRAESLNVAAAVAVAAFAAAREVHAR